MVTEAATKTGWEAIQKRWSPDGRNLRCQCGRWCECLFQTEANPTPRCSGCIKTERDERKAKP